MWQLTRAAHAIFGNVNRSKINLPALNLVAQNLPETEISGAPTEVAGKGSDARTALAKNGMRGAGQLPYLGNF